MLKKADAKVAPQSVGEREWPGSETLLAFGDAARWMFDCARQGECHFSFQAVCSRLGIDAWTVRGAIREKLTPHQQAWITAMGIERGKVRGRA